MTTKNDNEIHEFTHAEGEMVRRFLLKAIGDETDRLTEYITYDDATKGEIKAQAEVVKLLKGAHEKVFFLTM